ncbi:MAG: EAL domain-containing protein [Clostridiales Family XIII bacterium]|jgi:lactose/cellobiose-specific phosphotransferase system IIC component|nr:EAL domain-containing protein [Clostridiales Family XIII bacterium]
MSRLTVYDNHLTRGFFAGRFWKRLESLSDTWLVMTIRQGFLYTMPFMIIGSIAVALINLPVTGYQNFMAEQMGAAWESIPLIITNSTTAIIAVLAVLSISFAGTSILNQTAENRIRPIFPMLISLSVLISFAAHHEDGVVLLSLSDAGSQSVFKSMVIAILVVRLVFWLDRKIYTIFPPKEHRYSGQLIIKSAFRILPTFVVIVILVAVLDLVFRHTPIAEAFEKWISCEVSSAFGLLFMQDNVFSMIMILLVTNVLWFFGIHGGNVFMDAYANAMNGALGQSADFAQMADLTHLTKEFFDIFVYMGGSGTTLAMLLALLIFGDRNTHKKLAVGSIFPSIFNINESLIYGLPVILNPFCLIPFLLAPIVVGCVSYGAILTGLVPPPVHDVMWSTPVFISGYVSTGSFSAVLLQFVCLVIAFVIYVPFLLLARKASEKEYVRDFNALRDEITYVQSAHVNEVLGREDEIGSVARYIAHDLDAALKSRDGAGLHLQYQPKTDVTGTVVGAEALLRWNHELFGFIAPPITLGIADEANLGNELGRWVIHRAIADAKRWRGEVGKKISLSINMNPPQLSGDEGFADFIKYEIEETGASAKHLEFEITENATLVETEATFKTLETIRSLGASVAIDDFGLGHSSIKYISDYYANVVKLDASLVYAAIDDEATQRVVKMILDLCRDLKVKVVAEGVETKEQVEIMSGLGTKYFQGYYFSKPLPYEKFVEFAAEHGTIDISDNFD